MVRRLRWSAAGCIAVIAATSALGSCAANAQTTIPPLLPGLGPITLPLGPLLPAPLDPGPLVPSPRREPPAGRRRAIDGEGMWIWYLSRAGGGDPARIASMARRRGIDFVVIKGGDGVNGWSQLTSATVRALEARGLRVCGWQFVYGRRPLAEAAVGARIAGTGVDCLVIDAEGHYEGRYAAAQRYVRALRRAVGPRYPLGLSSFPYVHYHPGFPYSVFFGPGGAQFNLPQAYWRAIGAGVDRVVTTTYLFNSLYRRPIYPVGDAYLHPSRAEVRRFRQLAAGFGSRGVSWWSWQHAAARDFANIGEPAPVASRALRPGYPVLGRGARGDLVVWAQQHLRGAGHRIPVDGVLGRRTTRALGRFQAARGLPPSALLDARTWRALLAVRPAAANWARRAKATGRARAAGMTAADRAPRSAPLPAVRNEIEPDAR